MINHFLTTLHGLLENHFQGVSWQRSEGIGAGIKRYFALNGQAGLESRCVIIAEQLASHRTVLPCIGIFTATIGMTNLFTFEEFINERMPAHDMCFSIGSFISFVVLWFAFIANPDLCMHIMYCTTISMAELFWYIWPCFASILIFLVATAWGPLVGVRDFHPSQIRWCLMHVVNLGLLYVINGSIMKPVNGHYVLVLGKSWSWSVSLNLHFIFYLFLCSVYCMMFQHCCWLFFFLVEGTSGHHFFYLRNVIASCRCLWEWCPFEHGSETGSGPTKSSSPGNHLEAFAVPNRSLQRKWFLGFVFRWGVFLNNGQGPGYQFFSFFVIQRTHSDVN